MEWRRQLFHLSFGLLTAFAVFFFNTVNFGLAGNQIMLIIIGVGFIVFPPISYLISRGRRIPLFEELAEAHLRSGEEELPGKSAYLFYMSLIPVLIIFNWSIVVAGIVGASFADTASTIVGYYKGKKKVIGEKTWEGFVAGLVSAGLGMSLLIGFWKAFAVAALISFVELLPLRDLFGFDDNLILPLTACYFIWVL